MTYTNLFKGAALAAVCAVTLVACESGMPQPTSPSAVVGAGGAATNPDGTTLKTTTPTALAPAANATGISLTPTLAAQPGTSKYGAPPVPQRFQISTSDTFDPVTQTGMGTLDGQGITRWAVPTALTGGTKYFWRLRPESADQLGSWSATSAFTTTGTLVPPPSTNVPGTNRTPNPAPGQRLPLPDMRGELSKFSNTSDSCPNGIQYVNNPWLDRVIDHFRTFDTRWGYNAKPTRGPSQNGGRPVIAAGDESAYNYGSQGDEGTTEVHLVDMLIQHCGSSPSLGWRVFTGEEPGRWTGVGRF